MFDHSHPNSKSFFETYLYANQNCPAIYSQVCYSKNSTVNWLTTMDDHTHPKKSYSHSSLDVYIYAKKNPKKQRNLVNNSGVIADQRILKSDWLAASHPW